MTSVPFLLAVPRQHVHRPSPPPAPPPRRAIRSLRGFVRPSPPSPRRAGHSSTTSTGAATPPSARCGHLSRRCPRSPEDATGPRDWSPPRRTGAADRHRPSRPPFPSAMRQTGRTAAACGARMCPEKTGPRTLDAARGNPTRRAPPCHRGTGPPQPGQRLRAKEEPTLRVRRSLAPLLLPSVRLHQSARFSPAHRRKQCFFQESATICAGSSKLGPPSRHLDMSPEEPPAAFSPTGHASPVRSTIHTLPRKAPIGRSAAPPSR